MASEQYEKKVSCKREIKPHPFLVSATPSNEISPTSPHTSEVKHDPVLPLEDETAVNDEQFNVPSTVVRQPSFFFGEAGIGVSPPPKRQKAETTECCTESCPVQSMAIMDDDEYKMASLLSIFMLGIVSGASIVYAFSKPVVINAAAAL